jgi:hypothetical protein
MPTLCEQLNESIFGHAATARDELQVQLGRAHAPEPGDGEKAREAFKAIKLADGENSFTPREFMQDCDTVVHIWSQSQKITELRRHWETLLAEDARLAAEKKAATNYIDDDRIAEKISLNDHAISRAKQRLDDATAQAIKLMEQSPRAVKAMRRAGVDLRLC